MNEIKERGQKRDLEVERLKALIGAEKGPGSEERKKHMRDRIEELETVYHWG